jgi:transcriptional regulator of acetoin/glycerol metabolism
VKIVERVVEKDVLGRDPSSQQARNLISAAMDRLTQRRLEAVDPVALAQVPELEVFPTIAEVERTMILAAYEKSNRRPLEAERLLGIGKTTLYRKLREIGGAAT